MSVSPSSGARAQAIDCGGIVMGLPFSWTRSVIDDFELSEVPNAPAWLAGAANVDGRIVAVIDLAAWLEPQREAAPPLRSRLMLGGDGEAALAVRFTGLPKTVPCRALTSDLPGLPAALLPYVVAEADLDIGSMRRPVIDMTALAQALAAELAS